MHMLVAFCFFFTIRSKQKSLMLMALSCMCILLPYKYGKNCPLRLGVWSLVSVLQWKNGKWDKA